MLKRNTRTLLIISAVVLVMIVGVGIIPLNQFAYAEHHLDLSLHQQTKIYSKNYSLDYYVGCEDYDNYVSVVPSITFFTPGLGSEASVWSNDGTSLAYNSNSIIAGICSKQSYDVDLYYAKCNNDEVLNSFDLYKLDLSDYSDEGKTTARIDDVSKHILVLFESSVPSETNQTVYEQLDYVIDTISLQYRKLAGVLPRINLIGHSRGGLTNIQYATEHPYNVASVFSIGTPYNGSVLGQIDLIMANLLSYKKFEKDENGEWKCNFDNKGAEDIMTPSKSVNLRNNWNEAYAPDVNMNVVALGSMADLSFVRGFIHDAKNNENMPIRPK